MQQMVERQRLFAALFYLRLVGYCCACAGWSVNDESMAALNQHAELVLKLCSSSHAEDFEDSTGHQALPSVA